MQALQSEIWKHSTLYSFDPATPLLGNYFKDTVLALKNDLMRNDIIINAPMNNQQLDTT